MKTTAHSKSPFLAVGLVLALLMGWLTVTCSDPADTATPDASVAADTDASGEAAYPEGPYGYEVDQVIADLGFHDPWTGETVYFHEWYQDPDVEVLMVVSTALW